MPGALCAVVGLEEVPPLLLWEKVGRSGRNIQVRSLGACVEMSVAGSVFGAGREVARAGGTCGVRTPSGAGRRRGEGGAAEGTASCPDIPMDPGSQGGFYVVQTLPFSSISSIFEPRGLNW